MRLFIDDCTDSDNRYSNIILTSGRNVYFFRKMVGNKSYHPVYTKVTSPLEYTNFTSVLKSTNFTSVFGYTNFTSAFELPPNPGLDSTSI